MIKKIAWNTFKNTGNINTFLELRQIQNIEAQMQNQNIMMQGMSQQQQLMEAQNGHNQNEWYNNF